MNSEQNPIYLPILKGKKGEYDALKELTDEEKDKILPLIEVPSIPWNFIDEKPKSTIQKQAQSSVKQILKTWSKDYYIMIDSADLEDDDSGQAINEINRELIKESFHPIPVIRLNSSDIFLKNLVYEKRVCIRVVIEDNAKDNYEINKEIERIKNVLNLDSDDVYIVIDLGFNEKKNLTLIQPFIVPFINSINNINDFSEVFLAITSFPENLSSCPTKSLTAIPRIETDLYSFLTSENSRLSFIPKYADYGVANPYIEELDPRFMSMAAAIRYTAKDYWYIFKGRGVKQVGFSQFIDLAKQVLASSHYSGEKFSWGDKQIHTKATSTKSSSGNATTWRQIATNHHIVFMLSILSN